MLGNPISKSVLGVVVFCTAMGCGGGSKSKSAEAKTSPVASTPAETSPPETAAAPGAGNEGMTGTMGTGTQATGQTGSTDESARQPVSGTTGTEMGTGSQTGGATGTGSGTGTAGATSGTESTGKPAIGEPQIFALLTAANQHEIAVSRLALKQSRNKDVKRFAAMMVKEHGKMLSEGNKVAKKLKVKPEDNDDVKSLKSDSEMAMAKLKGLKGAEFDRAFTDQMVTDHQKVLDLLDNTIGPAASGNADLTKLVDGAKPKVQKHLEQATKLRDKVSSAS